MSMSFKTNLFSIHTMNIYKIKEKTRRSEVFVNLKVSLLINSKYDNKK